MYLNPNQINYLIKYEYSKQYLDLVYILVGFALVLLIIGFIGCTGILNENSCVLFIYFSFLFLIFVLQFSASVYFYVKSFDLFTQFKTLILQTIKYHYGVSAIHSQAVDYLHYSFKCCGWYTPKDWFDSEYLDPKYALKTNDNSISSIPSLTYKIPHSCCVNNYDLTCLLMHKFHEIGCEGLVRNYYNKIEVYVAWSLAVVNLFQLILLVLSLYLLCMIYFDSEPDKFDDEDFYDDVDNHLDNDHQFSYLYHQSNEENDDDRIYITSNYL